MQAFFMLAIVAGYAAIATVLLVWVYIYLVLPGWA
jgi:hypothetical protein